MISYETNFEYPLFLNVINQKYYTRQYCKIQAGRMAQYFQSMRICKVISGMPQFCFTVYFCEGKPNELYFSNSKYY